MKYRLEYLESWYRGPGIAHGDSGREAHNRARPFDALDDETACSKAKEFEKVIKSNQPSRHFDAFRLLRIDQEEKTTKLSQ